jgi:sensor c-di-GMP phosphodiesterase-like protein
MFSAAEIHASFDANEFFLQYLPTISLADNRCVGAEALIRWQRGATVVPPLEFIPQIENTPLSGVLTYWVIETVARELGDWLRSHEHIHLGINIPPEIIGRGGLRYAAGKANLLDVAHKLMFEVTERGLPDALAIAAIADAMRLGAVFALDDLNMNDANLIVLSRIRAEVVKFDKSFADHILDEDWNRQQLDGLAALIQTTGLRVIVEGIETPFQCAMLAGAGVQMGQGFYFSLPLSAADFMAYFSAHQ